MISPVHLLPNTAVANQIFTIAGNRTIIWDYTKNSLVKTLPDTPLQPRAFPSSATSVLLPLKAPNYTPIVLVCGGSSRDMPNPVALNDCYTINPQDANPLWTRVDNMPDGARTMVSPSDLYAGSVLIAVGRWHSLTRRHRPHHQWCSSRFRGWLPGRHTRKNAHHLQSL